jgi:phospholipid/cholesterol/gamma-HCH transport system substrate-binding protein
MSAERKGKELFAGLFLLAGLGIVAATVLFFGKEKPLAFTVEFPNATGLEQGSEVQLSGVRIGTVIEPPKLSGKAFSVAANLQITEHVDIPRASTFTIRSSSLLGAAYVEVVPPAAFDPKDVIQPNETVAGTRARSFGDLFQ